MSTEAIDAFDRTCHLLRAAEMAVSGLEDQGDVNALTALLSAVETHLLQAIDFTRKHPYLRTQASEGDR